MNIFKVLPHNHYSAPRIAEVMAQSGELSWGAPGWFSTDTPSEDGPYVVHYAWDEIGGPEFVGVDYYINGHWGRRWTEYPKFEWCEL